MEQARRDSATEKRSKTVRRISAAQSAAQCDAKLRRESDGVAQNLNAAAQPPAHRNPLCKTAAQQRGATARRARD
jgi:hypothetical protein